MTRAPAIPHLAIAILLLIPLATCRRGAAPAWDHPLAATPAHRAFDAGLDSLTRALASLAAVLDQAPPDQARQQFRAARAAYKRIECLLQELGPSLAALLNGPIEDEAEAQAAGPLGAPAGFWILESALFPGGESPGADSLRATVRSMLDIVERFRQISPHLQVGDAVLLHSFRMELARVSTLGLGGFDSDLSRDAVIESAIAIEGMRVLARTAAGADWQAIDTTLANAAAYLRAHAAFDSLDRLAFIAGYANPAAHAVAAARAGMPDPVTRGPRLWRKGAATVFERDAFDASAYAPERAPASPELVALGRRLFFEPRLSGPGTRSCALCHDPARAFTDGLARSPLLPGNSPAFPRNTPTLVNAAFQPTLFHDSRAGSLEAQAQAVLASAAEMGSSEERAAQALAADSSYRDAFARALRQPPDSAVTGRAVRVALAAYVRSLNALNSRFDRAVRGDTGALTQSERRGFTVYMGKGRCAVCHFLPLFNGTLPPEFVVSEPEIIGVPEQPDTQRARLDPDPGRAGFDYETTHLAAFKVPTLRNIALTAPYMHNGVYKTLDEVIDFYNRGGGAGIGAEVAGQTLAARKLRLTALERKDLRAFLEALTDTVVATDPETRLSAR